VIEHFIKPFEQYAFYTTKVDGLGAAYEVLGQTSNKDVEVGQFFTPENVVRFMVKLAELHPSDVIFDPACGTARFLTHSMEDMIEKAKGTRDETEKIRHIKKEQLFGTDDDPTVAKLAKMNMYIHGDGKTNIQDEDGLTQFSKDGKVDVILTNPPLGDLDYWRSIYDDDFRLKRMEVIPKKNLTKEKLDQVEKRIMKVQEDLNSSNLSVKQSKRLGKRLSELQQKKIELEYQIRNGNSQYTTSGKQMKGGALFLNAIRYYLKPKRDASELPEWRGGKTITILDEGILNTDNYKDVRDILRKHFFIKAIISLTRDTFVPISNTATKTSILYAIKKDDPDVVQQEPVFFGHAEKVGLDTRGRVCKNDLFSVTGADGTLLSKFFEFKHTVIESYDGVTFNRSKFLARLKDGMLSK
jgi:type I restriction enzyme M protein